MIVSKICSFLGCAEFSNSFEPRVTHLVIKEGKMTIKVANALAKCVPLVTIDFLTDYLSCLDSKQALPNPNNYVPPMKETNLNTIDVSLKVNPARRHVFEGEKNSHAVPYYVAKNNFICAKNVGKAFQHPL